MVFVKAGDEVEIDTSGGLRILELECGFFVVGQDMLIAVHSREEAREEITKIKELEC